ncbi:MAG: hypothetical protein U1E26_04590 [Coriobacteriia bacterium]|nr:hypothetical protein [Coriobacteriia bacterium]
MPIGTDGDGRDDNEGPHCRNCHVGASNCDVCHSDDSTNFSAAFTATATASVAGKTNYASQSYLKQSAVNGVGTACLDGGFSYPHRTLGANMLKDELYGVDFDGTPVAFGESRGTNGGSATDTVDVFSLGDPAKFDGTDFALWTGETRNASSTIPAVRNDSGALENTAVENMDSVCIDCHGDATYWNGDNAAFSKVTSVSPLPLGTYGSGTLMGWELLLKGLP